MKMVSWDGQVWYPHFYDMDTATGLDNSGYMRIDSDCEVEEGTFNTSSSNLWTKVQAVFAAELSSEWAIMRQANFTLDNIMSYIEEVDIPAKFYNEDAQVKYLDFGNLYTYACHGDRKLQMRRWLRERIAYVDSLMDYNTSIADQTTIRMNTIGDVTLELETYIPLYMQVKWSNAAGGTQKIRVGRGETVTFNYYSTTATDQEVILYSSKYIKRIGNISSLEPSTAIMGNCTRLTELEIHSDNLINVAVDENIYLRRLDFEGCSKLGTMIGTSGALNLQKLNYLNYINVYGTSLTTLNTNVSGGSIKEIYYPQTIQSISLTNQPLLETIGVPYGRAGEEIPQNLSDVTITNCNAITRLNMSDNSVTATSLEGFKYVQNLTLSNSLGLTTLRFSTFDKLRNITLAALDSLESVGFDNMIPVDGESTLRNVKVSGCSKLEEITFNVTDPDAYTISFATGATLDLSEATTLKTIRSNYPMQGIQTIIIPHTLENIYFSDAHSTGKVCSVENIWSYAANHSSDDYKGMDLTNINLKNIDMSSLLHISTCINFSLSPTDVAPRFNIGRDGVVFKFFQPSGSIDLTNYTAECVRLFEGLDMTKITIICNKDLTQSDFSYCFYNCIMNGAQNILNFVTRMKNVRNMSYMFAGSDINSLLFIQQAPMTSAMVLDYEFKDCLNLTGTAVKGMILDSNVVSAVGMFQGCTGITDMGNLDIRTSGSVAYFAQGCTNLTTVAGGTIRNVSNMRYMFEGCKKLTDTLDCVPASCVRNFQYAYANTGITTLKDFSIYTDSSYTETRNLWNGDNSGYYIFSGSPIERVENCYFDCDLGMYHHGVSGGQPSFFRDFANLKYVDIIVSSKCTYAQYICYGTPIQYFKLTVDGTNNLTSISNAFSTSSNTGSLTLDIDTSKVTTMSQCFYSNKSSTINFSDRWNTSNVTNMDRIFESTDATEIDFTSWDFSKVTLIGFAYSKFTELDLSNKGFNRLTTLRQVFRDMTNLTKLNLSSNNFESLSNFQNIVINDSKLEVLDMSNCRFPALSENTGAELNCGSRLQLLNLENSYFGSKINWFYWLQCLTGNVETLINFRGATLQNVINSGTSGQDGALFFRGISSRNVTFDFSGADLSAVPDFEGWGGSNTYIKEIIFSEDTKFPNNVSFNSMFKGCTNLQSDFIFPQNVLSAVECFSGCTGMKAIHSNWNTSYFRDITPTDCYAGCTGIQTVDGVTVVNDYSTGLDEVPTAWGGYGFTKEVTGIYRVVIPTNNYTFTWIEGVAANPGLMGVEAVNWGDGTSTIGEREHVYSAGTYIIKGNLRPLYNSYTASMAACITDVLQLPNNASSGGAFRGWTALKTLNIEGLSITSLFYFTQGCKSLHTITGSPRDTANCTSMTNAFANTALTNLDFMKDWEFPKLETADGAFSNISTLKSANIPNFLKYSVGASSNISLKSLFIGDVSLESIDASNWDFSRVSNMSEFIRNCSTIYELDLSNHDMSNVTIMSYFASGCSNLTSLTLPKLPKCANIFGAFLASGLKTFDMSCFSEDLTTAKEAFKNCSKLVNITGSYSFPNLYNTHEMFKGCTLLETELDMSSIDDTLLNWGGTSEQFSTCGSNMYRDCASLISISNLKTYKYPQTYNSSGSADIVQGCTNLTSISEYNVDFTQAFPERCSVYVTNDYWITLGWRWFYGLTNLSYINFTGTVYFADDFTDYRIFRGFNSSKLDTTTWQKFVNIFPDNSATGISKQICVGTNISFIPTAYAEQLTSKGYTLYASAS